MELLTDFFLICFCPTSLSIQLLFQKTGHTFAFYKLYFLHFSKRFLLKLRFLKKLFVIKKVLLVDFAVSYFIKTKIT